MSDMVERAAEAMILTHSIRQKGAALWHSEMIERHKRMARAALLAAHDPEDEKLREAIGRALALADWSGEWPLPTKLSAPMKAHTDNWERWEIHIDAVIAALKATAQGERIADID